MSDLIREEDFTRASHLDKMGLAGLAKTLMGILKIERLNDLYNKAREKGDIDFIDAVLGDLELNYSIDLEELERIPKEGPFITVSNHPLGGIDGLLLIKTLKKVRPDIKVMANFLLTKVEPINNFFLPVNPFEQFKDAQSSFKGIKDAQLHLESGGGLGIFPAGEVSTYNIKSRKVTDRIWQKSVLKFIKNRKVPVVPIYFEGENSVLFHLLGIINPMLRTAKLPSELFNKRDKKIQVRIGRAISVKEQDEFTDLPEYGRFLRAKTYLLGNPLEVKKFFRPFRFLNRKPEAIVHPVPMEKLQEEVRQLQDPEYKIFSNADFEVFCVMADKIPNILHEIGRLREITFREVGEGTGKSMDVDEFDLYYRHLFIWDKVNSKIVGAYRIGMGKEILAKFGKQGFYIHSLFKIEDAFLPVLQQTIELGRSFLIKEYQLKPLSLFMLWKGILYYLLRNPEYRYLIGPVSISGEFSSLSKYLIVDFIKRYHFDQEMAAFVKPRKEYSVKLKPSAVDLEILNKNTQDDLKRLDKMIEEIEEGFFRIPALLKKYLSQKAKIIAFNIDPAFNNSLDGLVVLDLFNIPESTIKNLSREMQDEDIMQKLGANALPIDHNFYKKNP